MLYSFQDWRDAHDEMQRLTSHWYSEVRKTDSSEEENVQVAFNESRF